ncbi:MAG: hypothetical protein ABI273_00915, partial [Lacunisphaera sp.]
ALKPISGQPAPFYYPPVVNATGFLLGRTQNPTRLLHSGAAATLAAVSPRARSPAKAPQRGRGDSNYYSHSLTENLTTARW